MRTIGGSTIAYGVVVAALVLTCAAGLRLIAEALHVGPAEAAILIVGGAIFGVLTLILVEEWPYR